MGGFRLATFRADVTPPEGAPLCGGRVKPVKAVDDPLWANGVILLGDDQPIVLCAVDWCLIRNADHRHWRAALAEAVGTTPERVAVQTVHQHDAPQSDLAAHVEIERHGLAPHMEPAAWDRILDGVAARAKEALARAVPVDGLGLGQAEVRQVAATRRPLDANGDVIGVRYSACRDEALRALPDGLIDPSLKSLVFYRGDEPQAVLHFYATHPMSHYGQGRVSSDFCGLARDRVAAEDGLPHLYFTGCAGDITAGKYNDGSPGNREVLTARMAAGMRESLQQLERVPLETLDWRYVERPLPLREDFDDEPAVEAAIADPERSVAMRSVMCNRLVFLRAMHAGEPIPFQALHLGPRVALLFLPGEMLIAYQLYAQQARSDAFVCTAAYGDGGPSYVPPADAWGHGGYEVGVSPTGPASAPLVEGLIDTLLRG